MVWHEGADECLSQIVKQVPTVGNLHRVWRSPCCRLRIKTGTVAADDLSPGMSTKPFRGAFRAAVRQQINDLPTFGVERIVPYRCPLRHAQSSMPNTRGPCAQGLIALRRN